MFDSFLRIISGYDEADHDQPVCMSCVVWCGVVLYRAIGHHHMFSMFCTEDGQYDPNTLHISVRIVKSVYIIYNLKEDSWTRDNNVIKLYALTRETYLKNWVLSPDNGHNYLIITLFHFFFLTVKLMKTMRNPTQSY